MDKFLIILRKTVQHELISGSLFVSMGFVISSFLSFVFNLFLARNLSYSDYGEYASLLSIFTLAAIPTMSLTAVVVRFAAMYFANEELDKAAFFYKRMLLFWGAISVLIFLLFYISTPYLSGFLKIKDLRLIVILGVAIAFSYFAVVNMAFLQSLTRFRLLSALTIFGSAGKLILGIGLIFSGFKVLGAVIAITLMTFTNFLIGIIPLKYLLKIRNEKKVALHSKDLVKYGIPTSLTLLFLSSFISSDVLLVKHFFSVTEAGYYGGLSLIGKVIFYFTGPIPLVMFPLLVRRHSKGESYKNLLYISLILVLLPSVAITLFYHFFPEFTMNFFLGGGEFLRAGKYLGILGVFLTIFSLVNVVVNFFLSLNKTRVLFLVAAGSLFQIVLIYNFHKTFGEIIISSILACGLLLIGLLLYYVKLYGFNYAPKS